MCPSKETEQPESFEDIIRILARFRQHQYRILQYHVSLRRLTILAAPLLSRGASYVSFEAVEYIQLPTYWREVPFQLGTNDECRRVLDSVGINRHDLPRLFYLQFPKSRGYVVAWNVIVTETPPEQLRQAIPL
jgi:hypothetical protein